jgi:hypothetical protein
MKLLVRAVITGFGLSIGAELYKRLAKQLGLEDKTAAETATRGAGDATADPGALHH